MENGVGVNTLWGMTSLHLYMKDRKLTQQKCADLFGLSQAGIAKMLRSSRDIRVLEFSDGTVELKEIRQIAVGRVAKQ